MITTYFMLIWCHMLTWYHVLLQAPYGILNLNFKLLFNYDFVNVFEHDVLSLAYFSFLPTSGYSMLAHIPHSRPPLCKVQLKLHKV